MRGTIVAAALAVGLVAGASRALAQAQGPGAGIQVDSIAVEGNRRVSRATVLNTAGISLHSPIGYRDIQRAIRALFETTQFDDVRILHETAPDGNEILIIQVRERPLLARATVRGVEKLSEHSVRDRIDLAAGRPLDSALVARAVLRIDSLYEAEGYYLAQVKPSIIPEDSDHVRVVFDITEGRRIAISAVRIEGNQAFSAGQIVKHMKTKPEGFWWFQKGEYGEDQLREDIEQRLPAFYGSRGYADFRVTHDTLLVDHANGKATLVVGVDEGRPYQVGSVTVDGNHRFSTDEVMSLNPFSGAGGGGLSCLLKHCGGPVWFDQTRWDAATDELRTQYANEGYVYATVEPKIERVEPQDSSGVPIVNLSWNIEEGRPAIINKIDIVGNETTYERVIREAIVVIPGDVFARNRVIQSYQNISNLGFFQQPLPFPDTRQANDQGDLDLVFRVQEKHTGNINFGASVGQGTGVGGFLGLDEPNLFGQGKVGHIQWQFGSNISQFEISYTDPFLFGSRVSGTAAAHDSRLRYTIADLGTIYTKGASLQFGIPLPKSRYSRIFPSYAIEWESYSGTSQQLAGSLQCRECLRSTLGLSFVRDTRIGLPFPTAGAMHTASVALTGGPLGGSATFQKVDLEGHWYAPAGQLGAKGPAAAGIQLVLGLTTKAGFVFGDAGPFFQQLYTMGGTQYGIPLRGYDEFSITPLGYNPNASTASVSRLAFGKSYFAGTAEFGARFSQAIYASLFYDVGNVWATVGAFNPTRLFRGAGFGVALITPLGPLGLDLGYGFDRVDSQGRPTPGWKLHFKIGNFFQ
jgi:outer membrane protein insertion porin family